MMEYEETIGPTISINAEYRIVWSVTVIVLQHTCMHILQMFQPSALRLKACIIILLPE